ncbi:hypothetical protein FIA58_017745 [Flavobacterium jejuense]|uniref:Lipoprotein n=1 Tax=Flavobacterium jejuense TaxID=1544455 RepID=A0ABX0IWG7_9FLAO|nr:hypothetical protein [Flavobacterium jejuense]NHN27526.1 hypothetical protein [Flavobacterium jejuense]
MNKSISLFLFSFLSISCFEPKENKTDEAISDGKSNQIKEKKLALNNEDNESLKEWFVYYNNREVNFSLESFTFLSTDSLRVVKGTVYGVFDKEYDTIYTDFLVFNAKKDKYIDFDSYNWLVDNEKTVVFSPDQEINLVDIENKTVNRIGFRGSLQWVEEAFWKKDSIIFLLENTIENQPIITEINLKNNIINSYQYKKKLKFKSEYCKMRLKKRGLIME